MNSLPIFLLCTATGGTLVALCFIFCEVRAIRKVLQARWDYERLRCLEYRACRAERFSLPNELPYSHEELKGMLDAFFLGSPYSIYDKIAAHRAGHPQSHTHPHDDKQ